MADVTNGKVPVTYIFKKNSVSQHIQQFFIDCQLTTTSC